MRSIPVHTRVLRHSDHRIQGARRLLTEPRVRAGDRLPAGLDGDQDHPGGRRGQLLDALTATQAELAAANHDTGVVSERERLAREIHDTIAQSLTGIVMVSQRAQRELASGQLVPLGDQLQLLEQSARDALVETRSLVAASAPVDLGGGIVSALERLAERFRRESGIAISVIAEVSAELDRYALGDR